MTRTIGIDTGGTFTDLVASEEGRLTVAKTPSIPKDPGLAVVRALEMVGGAQKGDRIVHGTTVALNAVLTGNVATVALVTNRGLEDVIEIGRQERPAIYALHPKKTTPLVPRALRFGIDQRIWPDPNSEAFVTIAKPTKEELRKLGDKIEKSSAQSVAVCLLHAWAEPGIEQNVVKALQSLELPISSSSVLLREHREFERYSTTIVNAALVPLMRDYLGGLEARIAPAKLELLQSSGGTIAAARAAEEPVRVLVSGLAGGVVGAAQAAFEAGLGAFVALDMGGTSTDVAFHDARAMETSQGRPVEPVRVGGHPITVPTMDIHTIGCGGGSLATVDAGGVLHVGPESAGADPGPVAYGKSEHLTLTDAHVFLGHVAPGTFLDGALELDLSAVRRGFESLGKRLGVRPHEAASGVLEVARAGVRRALGVMTMQRGHDPEALPLIAFGGAGGLSAAAVADSLRIRRALIPAHPGALSARGMCTARPLADSERSILAPLAAWPVKKRRGAQRELAREARERIDGKPRGAALTLQHTLDLRYVGQSFEIGVSDSGDVAEAFHRAHEALYGYRLERAIELVCLRTRALVASSDERPKTPRGKPLPKGAVLGERSVRFGSLVKALVIDRRELVAGHRFPGPAIVEEYSGTTLVPPGWSARVTGGGHLLLERS